MLLLRFFFLTHPPGHQWGLAVGGGHQDDDIGEGRANRSCRGHCSVSGPLQSVQRAEFWGVMLALQAADAVHLGVDNLGVARHVGRLLDGNSGCCPAELVKDGDLVFAYWQDLEMRGAGHCLNL